MRQNERKLSDFVDLTEPDHGAIQLYASAGQGPLSQQAGGPLMEALEMGPSGAWGGGWQWDFSTARIVKK